MKLLQPPGWARPRGYAHGYAARGTLVVTAGQLGWDAQGQLVGPGYAEQAAAALRNVVAVLAEAGARPEHLVKLTWYVSDAQAYVAQAKVVGQAYREIIGHFPAMTAFQVAALFVEGACVEIEGMAVIPD